MFSRVLYHILILIKADLPNFLNAFLIFLNSFSLFCLTSMNLARGEMVRSLRSTVVACTQFCLSSFHMWRFVCFLYMCILTVMFMWRFVHSEIQLMSNRHFIATVAVCGSIWLLEDFWIFFWHEKLVPELMNNPSFFFLLSNWLSLHALSCFSLQQ